MTARILALLLTLAPMATAQTTASRIAANLSN